MVNEHRRQVCALAAGGGLAWCGGAWAQSAPPPEAASLEGARLLGRATMRFLGLVVYEARLWVGPRFEPARYDEHPLALELQYARSLEGEAIARRSLVEMRRLETIPEPRARAWLAELRRAIPSVAPGERLTGLHLPGDPTRFFHNGRATSAVADTAFARVFFGIWLAPNTPEPALRRELMGAST